MKEQTALQELIEWMDTNKSHCTYGTIRGKATQLLTKEREQIVAAWEDMGNEQDFKNGSDYFSTTYKQP